MGMFFHVRFGYMLVAVAVLNFGCALAHAASPALAHSDAGALMRAAQALAWFVAGLWNFTMAGFVSFFPGKRGLQQYLWPAGTSQPDPAEEGGMLFALCSIVAALFTAAMLSARVQPRRDDGAQRVCHMEEASILLQKGCAGQNGCGVV